MTDRSIGPRCGNNPNIQLTAGDRKAVDDFKARLALKEAAKPYIERAVWEDGDPLMEVIASTLWEHCARDSEDMPQLVCDDPRTIAAFADAVARAHAAVPAPATDQAALRARLVLALDTAFQTFVSPLSDAGAGLELSEHLADAVLPVLPASVDRATVYRELADRQTQLAVADDLARHRDMATARRRLVTELRRMAAETPQPASTAPLAAGLPLVKGRCPACNRAGLFLDNGGYVTCSHADCPEPDAASTALEQPAAVQKSKEDRP